MKKFLVLFSAFGLSVSASASVASCDIFDSSSTTIKVDKNDFELTYGEKQTITISNFSELDGFSGTIQDTNILKSASLTNSIIEIEAIGTGSTSVVFKASNVDHFVTVKVKVNAPTHEIKFEYLIDEGEILADGYSKAVIKITNYSELVDFYFSFSGNIIQEYDISSTGTITILPTLGGETVLRMHSTYSESVETTVTIKKRLSVSDSGPINLYNGKKITLKVNNSSDWENITVVTTKETEIIDVKWYWVSAEITIFANAVGTDEITITADYIYEPVIIVVEAQNQR